ncbi:MAG TPA: hypothetical protein VN436_10635 [Holophaga sp.]|nr:hypothetical protein [Holophaga sp.]
MSKNRINLGTIAILALLSASVPSFASAHDDGRDGREDRVVQSMNTGSAGNTDLAGSLAYQNQTIIQFGHGHDSK